MTSAEQPRFELLRTGDAAFAAMLAAIDAARSSVRVETYILRHDAVGERFRAALMRAAQRGVAVQVLVDAFGSLDLASAFLDPLMQAGARVAWFHPLLRSWAVTRNHRKLLVCDEAVAFIGGFNLAAEYAGDGVARGWRDVGLRLAGKVAAELARSFDAMMAQAGQPPRRWLRWRRSNSLCLETPGEGELFLIGPGRGRSLLKRAFYRDLLPAQTVQIASAYFLPPWRLRRALMRRGRAGGRVQLLLAGRSDVALSQLASRGLYQRLLEAGVEIYEYQPQVLHAKLIVLGDVLYAGSANLDTRSLSINHELLVRIRDARLAAEAREWFAEALAHSRRIEAATWRSSRSFWGKLKERWAHLLLARVDPWLARRQLRYLK